jgi:hypothetical protein
VEPLHYLLADLSLYWEIEETNTIDIIDAFVKEEVFTQESGELLKEAAAIIYFIRVRLHTHYGEQREEAYVKPIHLNNHYVLQGKEVQALEKIYWLVLYPLYVSLDSVFKEGKQITEVFKLLNLPLIAVQTALSGVNTTLQAQKRRKLVTIVENTQRYQGVFDFRNRSGLSLSLLRDSMVLQATLSGLLTSKAEACATPHPVTQVKVISSSFQGYLRADVIVELLNNCGDIKHVISDNYFSLQRQKNVSP